MTNLNLLTDQVYEEIFDRDEPWYVLPGGRAILLSDLPLWDS